ncbi:MAG: hypothetical protein WCA38_09125 [Candidatus Acidiferrales bacterium]
MRAADVLLKPKECGIGAYAVALKVPVIASTSASRVYSGPLLPALQEALPSVRAIERRSMNVWEDGTARNAVVATNRKRLGDPAR